MSVAYGPPVQAQSAGSTRPPRSVPLVFQGVTLIDVRDGHRIPNMTVTITGHRIKAIVPTSQAHIRRGSRVVSARGKYLIPGLWDLHAHPRDYVDIAFPLFIANGVTGVRDAGSEVPMAKLMQWKREVAAGTRVGPRYLVSGPALDEARDSTQAFIVIPDTASGWRMFASVPPVLARYVVDSLQAAGADFIKMYDLGRAMYFAIAAEARQVGIPFGGHADAVGGLDASDSGATFLDHDVWLKPNVCGGFNSQADTSLAGCTAVAQRFRRNHTWITVVGQEDMVFNLAGQSAAAARVRIRARERRYLPASWRLGRWWDSTKVADARIPWREPGATSDFTASTTDLSLWHDAGIPMVIGTDVNLMRHAFTPQWIPGFTVHEALVGLVLNYHLAPLEALQVATLNAALALRATDSLGTIEAGKLADLVLLDADPLKDIWNTTKISAVVANGQYYDRAALDRLLVQAEQAASRW